MRPRHVLTSLAVGLAARALVRRRRARRAAQFDSLASDPQDPVQSFDEVPELQASPLDVDAVSQDDAEAAQDLAGLEVEIDETADRDADATAFAGEEPPQRRGDSGELYGAHTPAAIDREHPDDDQAFVGGQNWIEALETSAIENGAEPERELDEIIDDEDVLRPPHASASRDTPVADHGAGGRRGL
jgi:hypothetical protein